MGLSPASWGDMTLKEFSLAIEGFGELEGERRELQMWLARRQVWWLLKPHTKSVIEEKEIIAIPELDEKLEQARRESLPMVEVKTDARE